MLYIELLEIVRETKCGHISLLHIIHFAVPPSDKQTFNKTLHLEWMHKYASDLIESVSLETHL